MRRIIYGKHDEKTISQFDTCLNTGNVVGGVLCADGHFGYSQPVGGVIAYDGQISPSGVGYDIGCGNKAVMTQLYVEEIKGLLPAIMNDVAKRVSFGIGRTNDSKVDHELFDSIKWNVFKHIGTQEHDKLKSLAQNQLGTVGSGNHYVDILADEEGRVWIANHFGSRGFGHKTASGFLNLGAGRKFFDKAPGESMEQPPTLFDMNTELGDMYYIAMTLAGEYAYAGRDYVIGEVLDILGSKALLTIHNHHNYAWKEVHDGKEVVVVRKGSTPLAPGQLGFVGGSMCDQSVIIQGEATWENDISFSSTVHGAGRIMSRTQAAGKMDYKNHKRKGGGLVTQEMMDEAVKAAGIELRGAGCDESPFVYRQLQEVLDAHADTLKVIHRLRPIGVCMAGGDEFDPYKD